MDYNRCCGCSWIYDIQKKEIIFNLSKAKGSMTGIEIIVEAVVRVA